jgi:cytochrome c5
MSNSKLNKSVWITQSLLGAVVAGLVAGASASAVAGSVTIKLPADKSRFAPGPNVRLVDEECRECHSADYVTSQPPQDRAGWEKVVTKMIDKYGMDRLSVSQQALIVDYLVAVYGKP